MIKCEHCRVRETRGLECHMTSCYIHEHSACARANIMADITRARVVTSRLFAFVLKASLGIHQDHKDFNLESLCNIHSCQ